MYTDIQIHIKMLCRFQISGMLALDINNLNNSNNLPYNKLMTILFRDYKKNNNLLVYKENWQESNQKEKDQNKNVHLIII